MIKNRSFGKFKCALLETALPPLEKDCACNEWQDKDGDSSSYGTLGTAKSRSTRRRMCLPKLSFLLQLASSALHFTGLTLISQLSIQRSNRGNSSRRAQGWHQRAPTSKPTTFSTRRYFGGCWSKGIRCSIARNDVALPSPASFFRPAGAREGRRHKVEGATSE